LTAHTVLLLFRACNKKEDLRNKADPSFFSAANLWDSRKRAFGEPGGVQYKRKAWHGKVSSLPKRRPYGKEGPVLWPINTKNREFNLG